MAHPTYGDSAAIDPLWGYFSAVAGQDGQIDAHELQRCLTSSGIQGNYTSFSRACCVVMINMLDRDYSGRMGFTEFKELFAVLNKWKETFVGFDRDNTGTLEASELNQALVAFAQFRSRTATGSNLATLAYDDFIQIGSSV